MAVLNKAGLMAIIQPMTGLTKNGVYWDLDNEPPVNDVDRARVRMRVRGYAPVGSDEHVYTYTPGGAPPGTATFTTTEAGNRNIQISIIAEAYSKGIEATEILEKIRIRLNADVTASALNALGLAFQHARVTADLPTTYDNRVVSVASMDLFLGGVASYSATQTGQGWIDTVNTTDSVPGTLT